jgi:hypothetical protein
MSEQKSQQELKSAEEVQEALKSVSKLDLANGIALWQSLEQRGSDEKNRMIAAVTLVLGLAGACLVPALQGGPDVKTIGVSIAFSALSLAASTVGLIFVGFFAHHTTRNYLAVDYFELHPALKRIRDGIFKYNPEADEHDRRRRWLEKVGCWIAENKVTKERLFPRVGRIFDVMSWLSGFMMLLAVLILVRLVLPC